MRRAEKMQRNIWLTAHNPAVVARRSGRNVTEHTRAQFMDRAVFHRGGGAPGEHHPHMLDVTARSTHAGTHMNLPLPSWLVGGATDGHAPDVHDFELPFFEGSHFIRLLEAPQNRIRRLDHSITTSRMSLLPIRD